MSAKHGFATALLALTLRVTVAYAATDSPGAIDTALAQQAANGTVKVTPQLRSLPISGQIATIPYASIASFLNKPALLSEAQARQAPYVVALREQHLAVGAPHSLHIRGLQRAAPGR